jgi:hypothetical protein
MLGVNVTVHMYYYVLYMFIYLSGGLGIVTLSLRFFGCEVYIVNLQL